MTIFTGVACMLESREFRATMRRSYEPRGCRDSAWNAFATKIAAFLPDLIAAIFIVVFGWILCNIIKRIVIRVLRLVHFDTVAERAGIKQILERGGIRQSPSRN